MIPFAVLALLALALLPLVGCDSDEEDPNTATGPCGITLTRPLPGEVFLSGESVGEEVKIQWRRSGSAAEVKIELLKAGEVVGEIIREEPNDGWYFWRAENLGQPNGADFSVKVSAMDEEGCFDISPEFSLTNVAGCGYDFITPPDFDPLDPLLLVADGSTYEVTWFSQFTTGLVNLELIHVNDFVGYIATDVPDSLQSYTWTIDSLHEGSGSDYKIRIQDTKVPSCRQLSDPFQMVDLDVCAITVAQPSSGAVLGIGDMTNIVWTYQQVDGLLDITLSYKGDVIDVIATDVDPELGSLAWEVWAPTPLPEDNAALYQITISDNNNSVAACFDRSDSFLIED
jgi:hypothetical protein